MMIFSLLIIATAFNQYYETEAFHRFGLSSCRVHNSCSDRSTIFAIRRNENGNKNARNNKPPFGKPQAERRSTVDSSHSATKATSTNQSIPPIPKQISDDKHKIIEREIPLSNRLPLSDYKIGQKCKGTIVSVVKHGYFVDIGTTKDGLAHISDISKDYFIQNILSKYSPGQQVDVWIKFVDPANSKLGLQMFPLESSTATTTTSGLSTSNLTSTSVSTSTSTSTNSLTSSRKPIIFFPSESKVNGTVVKVSELGVFVDIGANVDAFLPKRKMKLTKKQMKFKPWEVHPLSSKLNAYVHEVDKAKNRISLTTYDPIDWPEKMPSKDYIIGANALNAAMINDDEELGGSSRSEMTNARSLQKTLSLTIDDDEDDEDLDDNEEGEELSMEEINKLTGGKRKAQLLMNDEDSSTTTSSTATKSTKTTANKPNKEQIPISSKSTYSSSSLAADTGTEEEVSTEELFDELRQGKSLLTYQEIKKWDYLKDFINEGEITEVDIKNLISECTDGRGKLNVDQFDSFIDLVVDFLGLQEVDEYTDGDDEEDTTEEEGDNMEDEQEGSDTVYAAYRQKVVPITGDDNDDSNLTRDLLIMDDLNSEDEEENEVATTHAVSLKHKQKSSSTTLVNSDMAADDIDNDDNNDDESFSMSSKGLNLGKAKQVATSSTVPAVEINNDANMSDKLSLEDHFNRKSDTNDLLQYVYQDVAGKKGYVEIEDVLKWDFTAQLIKQKSITEQKVRDIYNRLCLSRKNGRADRAIFEKVLDELSKCETTDSTANKSVSIDKKPTSAAAAAVISTIKQTPLMPPKGTVLLKSSNEWKPTTEPQDLHNTLINVEELNLKNKKVADFDIQNDDDDDEEEDDEYEEISIEEAFDEVSNGEDYVTFAALCQWEMVTDYIDAGDFSKEDLRELYDEAGPDSSDKMSFEGFANFIDLIAHATEDEDDEDHNHDDDEEEDEEEEEIDILMDDSSNHKISSKHTVKSDHTVADVSAPTTTTATATTTTKISNIPTDKLQSPEEVESLDDATVLKNVFESLAGPMKSYVSKKDLLNWDFVLDLFGEGLLDEDTLDDQMIACGATKKGLSLEAFDKLVDSLVDMYGEMDEDEDEDEGDDSDDNINNKGNKGSSSNKNNHKKNNNDDDDGDDDDDDVLDIDVSAVFKQLSQGKGYVTMTAFKKWDVMTRLLTDGHMESTDIDDVLKAAKIDIKKEKDAKMDENTLERVVDELVNFFESEEEEEVEEENEEEESNEDEDGNLFEDDDDTYVEDTNQLLLDLKASIEREEKETKHSRGRKA